MNNTPKTRTRFEAEIDPTVGGQAAIDLSNWGYLPGFERVWLAVTNYFSGDRSTLVLEPEEAREIAAKLNEAADLAGSAGEVTTP